MLELRDASYSTDEVRCMKWKIVIMVLLMLAVLSAPALAEEDKDNDLILEGVLLIIAGVALYLLVGVPILLGISVYGILKLITVLAQWLSTLSIFGGA